jgi:hypothetical protein
MEFNKTLMGTSAQLANGTPSDRVILKSFFKDDKYHLLLRILMEGTGTQYEHPRD